MAAKVKNLDKSPLIFLLIFEIAGEVDGTQDEAITIEVVDHHIMAEEEAIDQQAPHHKDSSLLARRAKAMRILSRWAEVAVAVSSPSSDHRTLLHSARATESRPVEEGTVANDHRPETTLIPQGHPITMRTNSGIIYNYSFYKNGNYNCFVKNGLIKTK
jgi:hypothetical protein